MVINLTTICLFIYLFINDSRHLQLIFSVLVSLIALSGVSALNVEIPKEVYEYARGDNVTIPCRFVPKGTPQIAIITWSAEAAQANAKEVRQQYVDIKCMCTWLLTIKNQHNSDWYFLGTLLSSSSNIPSSSLMLFLSNRTWSALIILLLEKWTLHRNMKVGHPWT